MCPLPCCTIVYYLCLAVVFLYLLLCVVLVPAYRYVALMLMALAVLYASSAWRLLPSERLVVRRRAEVLARQRCSPPVVEATALSPPCTTPDTLADGVVPHEPFMMEVRV